MTDFLYKITPDKTAGNTVRSDHSVPVSGTNKIGSLAYGREAFGNERWGDGVIEDWLHVLLVDGVAMDGWIASIHNGGKVATIKAMSTLPPVEPPAPGAVKEIIDSVVTWKDEMGVIHTTRLVPEK